MGQANPPPHGLSHPGFATDLVLPGTCGTDPELSPASHFSELPDLWETAWIDLGGEG